MTTTATRLAEFAVGTTWSGIPVAAQDAARHLLVDAIACAIAGRDAPARADFAQAARGLGAGRALVVSDPEGAGRAAAALLNAWQATATTMCDVFRPRMCHVSPPLLGAALATTADDTAVEEVLRAVAIGAEVTVRLCEAMDEGWYRGARWHAPGVVGPFGAATTAGLLSGLDAETLERTWGLALLQSAGTFAAIGSPGVKFTQARAALAGVLAVDMTRAGLGGQLDPLEHPDGGLLIAYGGADADAVLRGIGDDWRLHGIALRRWPAASSLQSVIEAVLALRRSGSPERIVVELPPQSFALCADKGWPDQLTALQSARWVAATVWRVGDCRLSDFSPESLLDSETAGLAGRVEVREDVALGDGAARVLVDGAAREVAVALGTPARPLDAAAVEEKLVRTAGDARAARLLAALDDADARALRDALRG
ncbi:MmgE/PrpD family protein [Protaetiibacter mangrovi]|uniref:MmgE/PrpD family protein n=2 Tax=Microbacteriaceae TaxID=85023 RepID=A0ABT1ZGG6_9MICO|nr:MmgE/PrpD family protein [Protaetiibacter mangrovi]MCS0499813.1 MmgE/PrpD family protein [Protaetiibacter mangrovi]TPX04450.1 MmgE/PrpD family protein [Schumannella luteola]